MNANVYEGPLDPKTAALPKLRPDIDTHSIGGVVDPKFVRTAYSKWWNRTHLDYALAPASPALNPSIGFQPTDLSTIGLRPSWDSIFEISLQHKGERAAGVTIQSESADRAFGLYLEPSFGISFPTNPGPLAPIAPAAFAKYEQVNFGGAGADDGFGVTKLSSPPQFVRMRLCLPSAATRIKPATAVEFRTGSPEQGPLLARVVLNVTALAHQNCGYLIGSYWLPGVMNDDPAAMSETSVALEHSALPNGWQDVYLSIAGGGHVSIDWFRFE